MHVQFRMYTNGRLGGRFLRGRVLVRRLLPATGRRQSADHGPRRGNHAHGHDVRPSGHRRHAVRRTVVVPTADGRHDTVAPKRVGRAERVQAGRHVGRPVGQFHGGRESNARQPLAAATSVGRRPDRRVTTVRHGRTQTPSAAIREHRDNHRRRP